MADGKQTGLGTAFAVQGAEKARRDHAAAVRKLERVQRMIANYDKQAVNPNLMVRDRHEMMMLAKSYRNALPRFEREVETARAALEDAERDLAESGGAMAQ